MTSDVLLDFHIREATEADLPAIVDIFLSSANADLLSIPSRPTNTPLQTIVCRNSCSV
jgi:hypothetical protein